MREAVEEIIHAITRAVQHDRVRPQRTVRVPRRRRPHHARSTFVPVLRG